MDTTIQKWGNSLAVRIPKAFAEEVGLGQGSKVNIQIVNGQIVIKPITLAHDDGETLLNRATDDHPSPEGDPAGGH